MREDLSKPTYSKMDGEPIGADLHLKYYSRSLKTLQLWNPGQ